MKYIILYPFYLLFKLIEKSYWAYSYQMYFKKYPIDKKFLFNGRNIKLIGEGEFKFGPDSYVGDNSTFSANKGYTITIGKGCKMSHNIKFYSNSFNADQDFSQYPLEEKNGNITLGNYVWVGANVFFSPGITVGDNAVIGANSLVNKDVEANAIVGGVPAKFIRFKAIQ